MRVAAPLSLLALLALASSLATAPAVAAPSLGVATPIEDPGNVGLGRWYASLKRAAGGQGVVRALQYGDSTIAADGFTRTVRARLAARFGDAGPGFVSAAFDPAWNKRVDVSARRTGEWTLKTILHGGAGGRYGLGGIVGILRDGASATVKAVDAAGTARGMTRAEVWYQAGEGYGTFWASVDGAPAQRAAATASSTDDRRWTYDGPVTTLAFGAAGGPVPLYGVVLETGGPGITWEALGVIGVGSKSFSSYAKTHLGEQMRVRDPDLVVVMIGGNEAGYPALLGSGGAAYAPIFQAGLQTILAGAPDASCLVVTPLDQGFVDEADGVAKSKPGMANLVAQQRAVAHASGCAFWDTRAAMGGKDSAARWGRARGIGTGDYVHVTAAGLDILGNLLSDALLTGFDAWNR